MTQHFRLSPSSSSRWMACPGSARDDLPDDGGREAYEGTMMHEKAAAVLLGKEVEFDNDESRKHVFTYVNYVREHASDMTNAQMLVEKTLVSKFLPGVFGGTPDCLLISDEEIHVIDFKYGLKKVKIEGNTQLKSYLVLANNYYPGRSRFTGSIVQPRVSGAPRAESFEWPDLQSFAVDAIEASASRAIIPGPHCQYCPVLQTVEGCDANFRYLSDNAGVVFEEKGWSIEKCKLVLELESMLKPLVNLAKQEIRGMLLRGEVVDGWRLAKCLGNRKFLDKDTVSNELQRFGLAESEIFETKLRSPAQLEKLSVDAKKIVDTYAIREDNGVIAVTDDSRLPLFDPNDFEFPVSNA